ncbi:glycosyltransferase [Candidatus Gracilibacteria bacterium]|nr:glycosyltransferase [Candidatus Gracilibacteria bacterium]
MKPKRIAIITDWLTSRGGAEHVNTALAEMFPDAVIFTSVYKSENFPELRNREVRTSFLQKLPQKLRHRHQLLLPFFPWAFEKFDLSEFDLIISSASSGFSKCVRKTRPDQVHVCYCHTPVRFLYHAREEYLHEYPVPFLFRPLKFLLPTILNYLTRKDQEAVKQVDYFISNSDFVGKRIKEFYHRDSKTFYPCVDTEPFLKTKKYPQPPLQKGAEIQNPSSILPFAKGGGIENPPLPREMIPPGRDYSTGQKMQSPPQSDTSDFLPPLSKGGIGGDFFLAVGRFIPYKKFDLLVETFAKNKLPLKLVGKGPDLERCQNLAKKLNATNIEFLGFVENEKLPALYAEARAFLFPAEEDFGLTPVEAICSGTPVIYLERGGARESVGKWGIGFSAQTSESLQRGIDEFLQKEKTFAPEVLRKRGAEFDRKMFQREIRRFIEKI